MAEWRCLSFLDSRVVAVLPEEAQSAVVCWRWEEAATAAIESSLTRVVDAAERYDSTAWLAS
jgi:hypothetical protein